MEHNHWLYRLIVLLNLSAALGFSQTNTAEIAGLVIDPNGAVVADARVQARNEATGASLQASSDATGWYRFHALPPGFYTLRVEAAGFRPAVRDSLSLSAAQSVRLDVQLELGDVTQSITVVGSEPLLDLSNAQQRVSFGSAALNDLPLAKQDWTGVLQLSNAVSLSGNYNQGVTLNGLPPAAINLTVDGTNAAPDPELPAVGFYQAFNVINTINSDAIENVSITKGIAPASVSGTMSGNINIVTKGGTNQMHGDLFELNSVSTLAARNTFLGGKPRSTYNQFGGALGGPIVRDRLFYFGSFEAVRSHSFSAINGQVPTPEFVQQTLATAPWYGSVFSAFPGPNQPYAAGSTTGTYIGAGSAIQEDSNGVVRVDGYATSRDLITLRYTRSRPYRNPPNLIPINARVATGHEDAYNAQYTHSGANWTSNARFGYNRLMMDRVDGGFGVDLQGVKYGGFDSKGAESYHKRGGVWTLEGSFTINHGAHTISAGGILQRMNDGRIDSTTNSFQYSSLSDFRANIPSQIQINFPLLPFQLHMYQTGGYFQDDYHVRRNLTLNLGFRYDYWTVPKEAGNRVFNRDSSPLGWGTGPFRPASSMYDAYRPNFGPRLGLAWSPGKRSTTVVRAGAGIFFNPHPMQPMTGVILNGPNVPYRLTLNRAQALSRGLQFPVDTAALMQQVVDSGAPVVSSTISPYFPNPYSIQWTAGVQHDFGHGMMIETAYLGNHGLHETMVRNVNLADRMTGAVADPVFGSFRFYDSSDANRFQSWQTSFRKSFSAGLSFGASYTWSKNLSFGDADLGLQTPPQDNNNLRADIGPTPYDVRHSFNANSSYVLPFDRLLHASGGPAKLLAGGWQVAGIFTAQSGLPVNITNGSSSYPSDRPDLVYAVDPYLAGWQNSRVYLTKAAFSTPPIVKASGAQQRPGGLGRYALRAPGAWNLDLSAAKNLEFGERIRLKLRADLFDALNHANLSGLVTDISKGSFGTLTSATSRTMQLGAKLTF